MKRQADAGATAAQASRGRPTHDNAELRPTSRRRGFPRRAGESPPDYTRARATNPDVNLQEGKSSLEKQDFANALARFRLVDRDQKGYQGVDALIADTTDEAAARRSRTAMDSGQQNEQADKLRDARQWYQRAAYIDPNVDRCPREGCGADEPHDCRRRPTLFNQATFAAKSGSTARARRTLQADPEPMLPGDEIRDKAASKSVEKLKR